MASLWESSVKEQLTTEATAPVMNINNSLRVSSYFKISEKMWNKALAAAKTGDSRTTYVFMKRYAWLVIKTLPKHISYGEKQYLSDRNRAKQRAKVAIEWIQKAADELKERLKESGTIDAPAAPGGNIVGPGGTMRRLTRTLSSLRMGEVASNDGAEVDPVTADLERRMRALMPGTSTASAASSAPLPPPAVPGAMSDLERRMAALRGDQPPAKIGISGPHSLNSDKSASKEPAKLSAEDRASLAALGINPSAYANPTRSAQSRSPAGQSHNLYGNIEGYDSRDFSGINSSGAGGNSNSNLYANLGGVAHFTPYTTSTSLDGGLGSESQNVVGGPSSCGMSGSAGVRNGGVYASRVSHVHPDLRKQEADRLLRCDMESLALRVVDCVADGNCLFRAVSHQLFGTESRHPLVRLRVVDYMRANESRFVFLVDPPTSAQFQIYLAKRQEPVIDGKGEWGDHAEIVVMEEVFDRPIEIYSTQDGPKKPKKTHLEGELPAEMERVTPIRLHYQGGNHYNSVVRTGPGDNETIPLPPRTQGVIRQFREMCD